MQKFKPFMKISVLMVAKILGVFLVVRYLTRKKLRILCYHGFSLKDQSLFRPKLFIQKNTFKSRIDYLRKNRYQFIEPYELDDFLKSKTTHDFPVLLTIDDGWKSTHEIALPILKDNNIPHIVYLYTDCYERGIPVLNVLLQYALWKTDLIQVFWCSETFNLKDSSDVEALLSVFMLETDTLDRKHLHEKLTDIFKTLEVDYSLDQEWKCFSLLNEAEIKEHLQYGGSFHLHTHHHINPLKDDSLTKELTENRLIIEDVTGQKAEHFCYPSGVYSADQFPLLEKLGIKSAVTCIPGLNDKNIHTYELKRFLDGENISQLEFEAEMSGFLDISRKLFRRGNR